MKLTSKEQAERIKREELERMREILDNAKVTHNAVWTKDGRKLVPSD